MASIPAIAFAAYSGTGKTTLIEKIIRCLKEKGVRLAVIKHDAHDFDIDHEGKDTWRFTQAGADMTIIGSSVKTAIIDQREHSVQEIISRISGVDLILVEGYTKSTSFNNSSTAGFHIPPFESMQTCMPCSRMAFTNGTNAAA